MDTQRFVIMGLVAATLGCKQDASRPTGDPPTDRWGRPMVELSILYGSEKKTWLDEQIQAFNAECHALGDGRVIHVTGKAIGSGEAMTGILDGSERPIVFSPASGAYVTLLDQAWQSRDGHTRPIAPPGEPLVLSPIVIAMRRPMAEVLGWPNKPIRWSDSSSSRTEGRGRSTWSRSTPRKARSGRITRTACSTPPGWGPSIARPRPPSSAS